jgi:uncharacterized protein (TIGR03083 family)
MTIPSRVPRDALLGNGHEAKRKIVLAYGEEHIAFVSYLESLPPNEWSGPTLCAEWDVKAVASHLLGQAEDFLDPTAVKNLRAARRHPPNVMLPFLIAQNQRHYDEGRSFSPQQMVDTLRDRRGKVGVRISQIPGFKWALFTVKGAVPMRLPQALATYVLEAWVHRQDVQSPRGDSDGTGPFAVLLPAVFFGITRLRVYDLDFVVSLDLGREGTWSLEPRRQEFAPGRAADAAVTVTVDAADFVLLAAGRLDSHTVDTRMDGDSTLGAEFLRSVRYIGLVPGL